ncbi:hypothetical protein [Schleiferilactobacillus harbinensis]|jgi:hypothetical protein|uniref:Uncharacterized protein n=1 Tax=Schleiferilactobacillus harbinensis TaxID=304207 RepID=A0A5P8M8C9_9LACO|nr:hypothetical protein [Schleiferilactobacillus harbinensis]QFR24577.1 hypothetical protein D1010_15000 [Schleiferilactobacillus harbinensis]
MLELNKLTHRIDRVVAGAGRLFDLGSTINTKRFDDLVHLNSDDLDALEIQQDWENVGDDLRIALGKYSTSTNKDDQFDK